MNVECCEGGEIVVTADGRVEVFYDGGVKGAGFPVLGAVEDIHLNDEVLEDLKWSAVKEINAESGDLLYLVPVDLVRATKQIVSGILYNLEIKVGQTGYLKRMIDEDKVRQYGCKPKETGRHSVYVVEIWVRKWENFHQVTVKELKEVEI
ncbi:hypothetical protein QR680_004853 [Steinernema hermaphroditum]|uniref:Cystatin domain-containing protein n=1 Tax=Steinernema hermaphroditum TaxID=289476 RepID=A0AA39HSC6_9BILA|nr:hypothetical protein QR680_004853 [Steinernema hermaphroditum]